MFLGKGVLRICCKFTEEHPRRSVISIKLLCKQATATTLLFIYLFIYLFVFCGLFDLLGGTKIGNYANDATAYSAVETQECVKLKSLKT